MTINLVNPYTCRIVEMLVGIYAKFGFVNVDEYLRHDATAMARENVFVDGERNVYILGQKLFDIIQALDSMSDAEMFGEIREPDMLSIDSIGFAINTLIQNNVLIPLHGELSLTEDMYKLDKRQYMIMFS